MPTPNGSKIEDYATKRAARQAAFEAQMARMDYAFAQLDEARAALRPPRCETCQDMRYVAEATGDEYHPTRLVPCPVCGDQQAAPDEPLLEPLVDWYARNGGATQVVFDVDEG
jgi:hypothetical protein